jgi:hypothetical protein
VWVGKVVMLLLLKYYGPVASFFFGSSGFSGFD